MTVAGSTLCQITTNIPGVVPQRIKLRVRPNDSVANLYRDISTQLDITDIQLLLSTTSSHSSHSDPGTTVIQFSVHLSDYIHI